MTFACEQCGAALAFAGVRSEICPYCASPNVVERPGGHDQPSPSYVVAFAGDRAWAQRELTAWLGKRRLFADGALARGHISDLRGVYLPAYLYSSIAHTEYTAEIGEHYTETETVVVKDKQTGEKTTQTRTVTRTEYRPLAGSHVGYITDVIVSASTGLDDATLQRAQPFDLRQLRRFTPAVVSGWVHEEYARSREACHQAARAAAAEAVGDELRAFMPGDSHADLAWRTRIEWESLDPILVPIWMFVVRYRDDKPPLRIAINGQTGKVAGSAPIAWWKVAIAIAIVAAIAGFIAWRSQQ